MAAAEIVQERDERVHIVVHARDVVAAAEVHPFHLRQQVAKLFLEPRQDFLQLRHALLAQAVEMQTRES